MVKIKLVSKVAIVTICLSTLFSCGGGSVRDDAVLPVAPVTPPVIPPTGIADPIFPPNNSVTNCNGLDFIERISVESDSVATSGFEASKAIDNDLTNESRWQSSENGAELTIDLGYRHLLKEIGTAWYMGDAQISTFDLFVSEDGIDYTRILTNQSSSGTTDALERFEVSNTITRFVRFVSFGANDAANMLGETALKELAVFACPLDVDVVPLQTQTVDLAQYQLDPNVAPGENFDLLTWALDTPRTDPSDGFSLRASERDLDQGFEDDDHFYTASDGAMVFRSTIFGAKTSANTSFTRSELREMLRRGNTSISTQGVNQNNWILGYQPNPGRPVGGRGGSLKATLRIDKVTLDGSQSHTGRLIVGQIHAGSDEPIRLYYKKFPNNERGYIYFAHELNGGEDIWKMVLGPTHSNTDNQPIFTANIDQGIALEEIFSYEIEQQGARIDVFIRRGDLNGPIIAHQFIDMEAENSGYDQTSVWNYFKAGAYSQNNTGDSGDANGVGSDYDQVRFYYLSNTHGEQ
ncbi:polysaccharide lyase family 7 protein [Glaciecola petra]|uniref:Polysaccharide lyase family 7 protein n=1 Tax=Glaciecola petra TaxID=3075602 RepID=A0ABU2ZPW0_9ALTE|nr:polysaccharide lyase family 7 protein [Aestuariibacter sp. P117]MDT0594661.1 polysaccharide lyase family 7 protein [Aestuariibacter sp. P117]